MAIEKRVGDATSAHERALEGAVARVLDWTGRAIRYAPLVGGLMNQNWLVTVEGDARSYFVKVPGAGSEMFINRGVANEAARNAHAIGVAPEVIFFDPADGVEISEFLTGYRACTNADFTDPTIQSAVLGIYRAVHGGAKLSQTKTIFDMIEEHIEQGHELGAHFPRRCRGSSTATRRPSPPSSPPASTSSPASTIRCPATSCSTSAGRAGP